MKPARLTLLTLLTALASSSLPSPLRAQEADSVAPGKRNIVTRFIDYLNATNTTPKARGIDLSLIGGPFYSSDTKFGIGLVAAGQYYNSPADSGLVQPSNVALKAQVSTTLFYKIGIDGVNLFPRDRMRLYYGIDFAMLPTYNWGTGWTRCNDDAYKSRYRNLELHASVTLTHRIVGPLYGGVLAEFYHTAARKIERPDVWDSYPLKATDFGLGVMMEYDTRDYTTSPTRGYCLSVHQKFFPRFLGNSGHGYSLTAIELAGYWPAWRGAVVAARARGIFTYGNTPWMRMPTIGGSRYMRGYYEGQYRDRRVVDAVVELRQHVWKRSGVVAWAGCAELWNHTADLSWRHILPNYGVGYRFEFKHRMNVRVDVGFGRYTWGVEFNMNEAF